MLLTLISSKKQPQIIQYILHYLTSSIQDNELEDLLGEANFLASQLWTLIQNRIAEKHY